MTQCLDQRKARTTHQKKIGGGWWQWAAGRPPGRPPSPLHNRLTSFDVAAPHLLTRSVLGGLAAEDVLAGRDTPL